MNVMGFLRAICLCLVIPRLRHWVYGVNTETPTIYREGLHALIWSGEIWDVDDRASCRIYRPQG